MSQTNNYYPLTAPEETFPKAPAQGCQRCSMKKSRRKKPNNMQLALPRVFCDLSGCASSFCRLSDLIRHKKTIHGPKQQCVHHGCQYATGRGDKMNDHVRKIHKSANFQANTSHLSLTTTNNLYDTEVLDELHRIGYRVEADQSMLLTGGVDWMQSWDVMNFAGDFNANFDVFGPFPHQ